MKKHLIAAAVAAAVTVPAAAQVTVSGTIDVGAYETRKLRATINSGAAALAAQQKTMNTGEQSGFSTSTINFSGSEDLGGGLKAGFFWNQTVNADTGVEDVRDGWLNVSGGFGEIKVGRFVPAGEATLGSYITGTTNQLGTIDPLFNWDTAELGRQGGNIQYTSPKFSGVEFVLGYNDGSSDLDTTAGKASQRQTDIAVKYASGPLTIGIARTERKMKSEGAAAASAATVVLAANSSGKTELESIGASYNLGAALVRASYFDYKTVIASAQVSKVSGYQLGLTVPIGAFSPYVNIYDGEDKDNGTAANKIDLKGHQVGVTYALSKRTGLYAVIGEDKATVANASLKNTGSAVGVRHSF
jgi:predicted porin